MNLMLYKDGRLVMNEQGKPLEGQESDLRNLYAYVADPADGDTLVYDSTAGMWKAGQGGGLFAPDISDPQDGDTLVYNAAQQKWVNGAGGGGVMVVHDVDDTLDKTWEEIYNAIASGILPILITAIEGSAQWVFIKECKQIEPARFIVMAVDIQSFDSSTTNIMGVCYYYLADTETGYPVLTEL